MKNVTLSLSLLTAAAVAMAAVPAMRSGDAPAAPSTEDSGFIVRAAAAPDGDDAPGVKLPARQPSRAKAFDVPFIEDFSSDANLGQWGIQDVNADGNSWEYKENFGLVRCMFPTKGDANDDWLVTPPINLGCDDIYTLSFDFGSQGSRYSPEALTVTMGTSEFATRHTTVLFSKDDIVNFWNGSMETITVTLPVEADGVYYFGFHCTSPNGGYALYLDNVKVEQNGSYTAPAAVADLKAVAADKGRLSATVTMTAPEETAAGDALTALDNVVLYRDDVAVHTFATVAPGQELEFVDPSPVNGFNTYKAIATAGGQEGAKAEVTVFVGVDAPARLTGLKAVENASDVALTWDAPTGVNGGYVGGNTVQYIITRFDSDGENVLDDAFEGESFIDDDLDFTTQSHVYYSVMPYTDFADGEEVESNSLFIGPAKTIPFTENFEYCNLRTAPWVMSYINAGIFPTKWRLTAMGADPLCPPVDGDDGMLEFVSKLSGFNFYEGNVVRLATPAISLEGTDHPFVSFQLFHYDTTTYSQEYDQEADEYVIVTTTYDDRLHLQIALDNGDYADIPDSEIKLAKNNKGWTLYTISLDAYKGHKKASIGLVATSGGGGNICVDHLTVTDTYASDLAFTGLLGPACVKVGERAEYTANIVNNGITSTKNYTVDLYVDDVKVDSQKGAGAAIFANGGVKTVKVGFTPDKAMAGAEHKVQARISFADDMCPANNASDPIAVTVPGNSFPKVEALNGSVNEAAVELSWTEPAMEAFRAPVTDDMEAHETFAISGFGDYTLIDNDGASQTYVVSGISSYPNAGGKMAWQVFDPATAGIDNELDFNRRWICHSGRQCLVSWGADASSGVSANDDWLISPELTGESQVISFYIKSISMAYPERFRVLYSTDSKSISDFVKIAEANYYSPTSYWRRFSVTLPEGAKYFAINNISADGFGLMVDDVTFTPASAEETDVDLLGYNVYRDGVKLTASPVATPAFTDNAVPEGAHRYFVTAQYAAGESDPSPIFEVSTSGVKLVESDSSAVRVAGHVGCIEIDGYFGTASVVGVDGRLVGTERVAGNLTFTVAPGIYIVRCGAKSFKIDVR